MHISFRSDRCKDELNNFMLFGSDNGPLLIKTDFIGVEQQTADNIFAPLQALRQEIKDSLGTRDTSYLSDNCNPQQAVRGAYTKNNEWLAYGCGSHAFNLVNGKIFNLTIAQRGVIVKTRIDDCLHLQGKLATTRFNGAIKPDIVKARGEDIVKKQFLKDEKPLDTAQYRNAVRLKQLQMLKQGTRVGIPQAGKTRKWNTVHRIIQWQLEQERHIKNLYVFQ